MGKVEDMVIISQVPGEHLPLLGQAAPTTTYLSQNEVVEQASVAPWVGLRKALFGLLGALFACMLVMAVLLLLTMPRPWPPLAWWQRASFYHLPPASFPDSNGDGHGDLGGVRHQLDQLLELPIQALVLGSILEGDVANLSKILPAHGSLDHLQALVNDAHKREIRILLELPFCDEELELVAEDNQTKKLLKRAMQFWDTQGVRGFMVNKEPPKCLEMVLDVWSELDNEILTARGEERVLVVWDESKACNISHRVPGSVILTCSLLSAGHNLTAQAVAQQVEGTLSHPGAPWPSWTVPRGLPMATDLGVLLLTLPGVPFLPGGKGSPVKLDRHPMKGSTNGDPLANLYRSLLALRANSYPLRGIGFTPLPLIDPSKNVLAFLRPGSCSSVLVVLNLGSWPFQLSLKQLSIPAPAKVLFNSHSALQREVEMEVLRLVPHQAILLRVPRGHGP